MRAELIDPRDARSLINSPTYRVEFICTDPLSLETWRISGATNVHTALAWLTEHREVGKHARLYAEALEHDGSLTLIRLLGRNDLKDYVDSE